MGNEQDVKAPAPPAAPTAEQMFEMGKTPEGRAKIAAHFGILNTEGTGDTIVDVFSDDPEGKAIHDDTVKHFGGETGFAAASAELTEAILIADPERDFEKALSKMTRAEESQAVKEIVAEWREILATPEKAQAVLTGLYSNPDQEPIRSYIRGNGSPAVNNAFAKLWQAAYGEKPTGLPPRSSDGNIY